MKFHINETADEGYFPYDILIDDTKELNEKADEIQKAKGKLPLFDDFGEYDADNWYNFYLECNEKGVYGLWFEYGSGEAGDRIEISEQDKANAFKAVCDFFGGLDGYKAYIEKCTSDKVTD